MSSELLVVNSPQERIRHLKAELARARDELKSAEASLSAEQAAVNRFRMHARLKIGDYVDEVQELRNQRQTLLTKLELRRQAQERGVEYDDNDPFWESKEAELPTDADISDTLVLPTDTELDKAAEKRLYRELAKRFHPDLSAGSAERAYATTMMSAINSAYQSGDVETLRDLAGELDPETAAKYSGGATREERKLRKHVLGCKRRLRKVVRQFKSMKAENTARLWRRAQQLEADGRNWWDEVRDELEAEAQRLREQIERLQTKPSKEKPSGH